MAEPKVAHVAGTGVSSKRDQFEVDAGFPARKDDAEKRMRRLSISGVKNPTLDASGPEHHYFGQSRDTPSAFVFGYRETNTSPWKFYAQIVKGVIAGTKQDGLKAATEKVVPLDQAYEIA
jgi:hypothetical protein